MENRIDRELYAKYAKIAMADYIANISMKEMCEIINQYYEDTMQEAIGGWYLENAEDIKRFLSESDFVSSVIEEGERFASFQSMLETFAFYEDEYSNLKRGWVFASKEDVSSMLVNVAEEIFISVINFPSMYSPELYQWAIEPFVAGSRFSKDNPNVLSMDITNFVPKIKQAWEWVSR